MSDPRSATAYRRLLHAYPRPFREEYEDDMVLLFTEQLRDEGPSRVWARTAVDLAITIPTRHLEAHMHRDPNSAVPVVFAAFSASGLVVAVVGGTSVAVAGLGAVAAVVFAVLASASWRRTRAVGTGAASHWWQVVAGGGGVLATTAVVVNVVGEVPDGWWAPVMLVLLAGIVTTAVGFILGIAHLTTRHTRPAA